jgi:hypothetical protein
MKKIFISGLSIILGFACFGQIDYSTRDSIHIFWQPGIKITYSDYKGLPQKQIEELMDKYGFSASASVGIWSVLDIPKKKKDRYKKFEKVYFAPAFERTTSYAKTDDTLQISMQNIYLDICEIWARWAREQLTKIQDSTKATGTLSIMYTTVKQEMNEKRLAMYRSYFKDVFVDKKVGALTNWRNLIDKWLIETKGWATRPEECYRLMTGKPIEEGYIMAPTLIGPMNSDKK